MTTAPTALDSQALHDSFRAWHELQEPLDAQLTDSLVALEAYQSHLDAWQCELASQRQALDREREQLERDRVAAKDQAAQLEKLAAELNEARSQIAALSQSLIHRTEELRELDSRRAELTTELELTRARERELSTKLEQHGQDDAQPPWADELKLLRELFDRQMELAHGDARTQDGGSADPAANGCPADDPVVGSIVEQFGKLQQQRALGRNGRRTG